VADGSILRVERDPDKLVGGTREGDGGQVIDELQARGRRGRAEDVGGGGDGQGARPFGGLQGFPISPGLRRHHVQGGLEVSTRRGTNAPGYIDQVLAMFAFRTATLAEEEWQAGQVAAGLHEGLDEAVLFARVKVQSGGDVVGHAKPQVSWRGEARRGG
jgi:hypothetical protein